MGLLESRSNLEEREVLLGEGSLLGEDARDGKHSKTAVLDLRYGVSLLLLGVFTKAQGVEIEITRSTSRALGLVEDSSSIGELQ